MLEEADLRIGSIAECIIDDAKDDCVIGAVMRCALCGLCSVDCPVDISAHAVMTSAREWLAADGVISTDGFESLLIDHDRTVFSLYRYMNGISYADLIPDTFDTVFFPGCILATYAPDLTRRIYEWLVQQGQGVALSEHCCGSPLISLGLADRATRLRGYMAERLSELNVKRLVTVCPGCHAELDGELGDVEVVALPVLLRDAGVTIPGEGRVTVHDSCRDRGGPFGPAIRELFSAYDLVEMEHHGENTMCCGSGGLVSAVDPDLYDARTVERLDEYRATGADQLVTPCLTCSYAMAKHTAPGEVVNYLELLFGECVSWGDVFANLEALWEGECALLADEHLGEARCFTGWEATCSCVNAGAEEASS
jgi:fumarate reductase (CoM/CoB) subunit B